MDTLIATDSLVNSPFKLLVSTATYNEYDNIQNLIEEIFFSVPHADILVIDDNSPDGTGTLLRKLSLEYPTLQVIHRPTKAGLGSAHVLAMRKAIEGSYDYLVTMDADFSHHPKYLPEIIECLQSGFDFVIGSRYKKGGKCNYGFFRRWLSKGANILAIRCLGIPLKETTTSYRGFRVDFLRGFDLGSIHSTGYSFFVECSYKITRITKRAFEIPIYFEDRRAGSSKIAKIDIIKGALTILRLTVDRVLVKFKSKMTNHCRHYWDEVLLWLR